MLHCLLYWPCRSRTRRRRSESEWVLASAAMWLARRSVPMAITRTIRIAARPTATTVRAGSRMGSLLAQAPGTAGDIRITDAATTVATLMADLRDADLKDAALIDVVLMDMARRFGAASQGAAP